MSKRYPRNLIPSMLRGDRPPLHGRALLKAVTAQEIHGERTGLILEEADKREVAYHEVVSVAEDVSKVAPGDLVLHISAAADIANHLDDDCPYLLVREDHILYAAPLEVALAADDEAAAAEKAAKDEQRLRANGLIV